MDEYAAYLGIDWADSKHDLCLLEATTGTRERHVLKHTPQAIAEYFTALRARYGGRKIAVGLEQLAPADPNTVAAALEDLATPYEQIENGIILASRRALTDSSYDSALGIAEPVRLEANKSNAPLQTIRPQFTSSRRPVIIFAVDAFQDAYPHYGDIINNCK